MATVTMCFAPYGYVDGNKSIDFILKEKLRGKNYELYKHMDIDMDFFDKEELEEELRENYEAFGEDEYFLADAWCDDSEGVQEVIGKIYTESYLEFFESLEDLFGDDTIEQYDAEVIEFAIDNYGMDNFKDHLDDIQVYDDVEDYYSELLENMEGGESVKGLALYAFRWLGHESMFHFLNAQGYQCTRLRGGRCLTWND